MSSLNFDNIQGDILEGLPKKVQSFVFFEITDATTFRGCLKSLIPHITTTTQALAALAAIKAHKEQGGQGLLTLPGINIAFSQTGLLQLGITDNLGDSFFSAGQLADASNNFINDGLSDPGTVTGTKTDPAWDPAFKQTIHGCILVTGDSLKTVRDCEANIDKILSGSIKKVVTVDGAVRPGSEYGHEHFGFLDSLSQPPVIGFRQPEPGEDPTPPGIILLGETGDSVTRPPWAKDSSFLVFRKLRQYVPEFNDFLTLNPIQDFQGTPESPAQGSDLLGARLLGRWKSGAPIELDPKVDVAADANPNRVNDFDYSNDPIPIDCPFTAHLRKMNPRAGKVPGLDKVRTHRIIRQGIPYGPEMDDYEKDSGLTLYDRGLLFICYQSSIANGFHHVQKAWANNPNFPNPGDGFDPIIGQNVNDPMFTTGMDPDNTSASLALPQAFVVPLGGEYFLSPSISALQSVFTS